MNSKDMSKLKF